MSDSRAPLDGVTVLEIADGLAGRAAGMLLADLGADVVLVEDVGDRSTDSHGRLAHDRNKRSVRLADVGRDPADALCELARRADVALVDVVAGDPAHDGAALPVDEATLRAARPGLVYCLLDGFGEAAERSAPAPLATDRTVQALSGCMDLTGHEGKPPSVMGLPLADLATGIHAAIAVVGILSTDRPRSHRIEVARYDVAVSMLSYMAVGYFADGEVPTRVGTGHSTIFPYNSFAAADGEVVVAPFTNRFWRNFCAGIERDDLASDERLRNFAGRLEHKDWLLRELSPVLATRTVDEWIEIFRESDVPAGPVLDVAAALDLEQTAERGMIRETTDADGATRRTVGSPITYRWADGGSYEPPVAPPPRPGHDTAAYLDADAGPVQPDGEPTGRLPLDGVRALDLTRMFAGPCATEILADLGADVIKVEEPKIGDPTRRNLPFFGSESAYFISLNRGKRSIALDLKSDEDRDTALRLAETADIVVENYRPGVMDRLGLGADELARRNPAVVVCSLAGFGASGPLRDKISFDLVNQAMAGTIELTGDPADRPARFGVPIGDMAGGYVTALAALAGLRAARRTGHGCHVDLALHDVLIALLGGAAQRHLDTGEAPTRVGNRDRDSAPVGCYPTADGWLVVDAGDDRSWHALVRALELPVWADDPRFGSPADRKAAEDEIDETLVARFAHGSAAGWADSLRAYGVPAAPVLTLAEALDSDLTRERALTFPISDPEAGTIRNLASPIVIDGRRLGSGAPTPHLGAHTDEILADKQEVS